MCVCVYFEMFMQMSAQVKDTKFMNESKVVVYRHPYRHRSIVCVVGNYIREFMSHCKSKASPKICSWYYYRIGLWLAG